MNGINIPAGAVMTTDGNGISGLIARLPEIYQPIYGHDIGAHGSSRNCEDRVAHIVAVHDALTAALGRPIRVLDLGCAQGYFSLHLAARGAAVVGVDLQPENIALCRALADENRRLAASFVEAPVEAIIANLPSGSFDLVLGLSVFHHLIAKYGEAQIRPLVVRLLETCTAGVFEFALAGEPASWAAAQPADVRTLFGGTAFVHELARIPTHLSDVSRPLYYASNSHWYLAGDLRRFDSWSQKSHSLVGAVFAGTRRYYFAGDTMAKLFSTNAPHDTVNRGEIEAEARFLSTFSDPDFPTPRTLATGVNGSETWLVRETMRGRLLSDAIADGDPFDTLDVVTDVLRQLAALERRDLYHGDLRLWNTLLDNRGRALLIDYGAISYDKRDCLWPENVYLAFFLFVFGVVTRTVAQQSPTLPPALSPQHLPEPYRDWMRAIWALPIEQWSFARFLETLENPPPPPPLLASELWLAELERYCAMNAAAHDKVKRDVEKLAAIAQEQTQLLKALFDRLAVPHDQQPAESPQA